MQYYYECIVINGNNSKLLILLEFDYLASLKYYQIFVQISHSKLIHAYQYKNMYEYIRICSIIINAYLFLTKTNKNF